MNPNMINRRAFLAGSGLSLGSAALNTLMAKDADQPMYLLPKAKAKRVIFLCMAGGPSHLETFDYKPKLDELNGKPMPESFTQGQPIAQLQGKELKVQGHLTKFKKYGKGEQYISDYLPWTAKMADDISIIRSMVTEQINHDPAHTFMNTGSVISGRPSMGSWVNYGLGSVAEDLPGFVVMTSVGGRNPQPIASRQWSAGFLPSRFQGVEFNSTGDPVQYVRNPKGVSAEHQKKLVNAITTLDRHRNQAINDPETDTRIAAYEMAFKMQTSVPELMDVSKEPQHILDMYGAKPGDGSYASNCLLARKLAEKGVRFIHLYHRGWDHHGGLEKYMDTCCGLTDKPTWALIQDLKQRGMLDDTLVVWGGEFGRTPMFQGKGEAGRDHHIKGFSMWMAGGGVKGGFGYGETDELGYHAVKDKVHVHDMHATMLHLLGIKHQFFSVKHQGLDWKLTGVDHSHVVKSLIA
ncbi:DUF1501 domain-containing protein [Candidatus Seribacter sulfatis]|uniref:DUF1501 domain-containing protein n=1 Tax=Candidatus Seribacter sulfatis TaxID=3381756 RepID=UPI00389AD59A